MRKELWNSSFFSARARLLRQVSSLQDAHELLLRDRCATPFLQRDFGRARWGRNRGKPRLKWKGWHFLSSAV